LTRIIDRMRILSRYLLRESIGPFFFGLAIITIVLLMDFLVDIMNLIIDKGLSTPLVIELFALNLAWMLALSVPMAVLVAVLMSFGRLSSDNEITACKACGISFNRLLVPMIGAGLVLTLAMIWFNDRVLPESNHRARMLLTDITRKKPTWSLEENIFLDRFEGYSIRVKTVSRKTSEISDVVIIQTINAQRIITAKRGKMYFSSDGTTLILELEDGEVLDIDPKNPNGYTRTAFAKQTIGITGASSDMERTTESTRGDREMTVAMMQEQNRGRKMKLMGVQAEADSLISAAIADNYRIKTIKPEYTVEISNSAERALSDNRAISGRLEFLEKSAQSYEQEINSLEVEIQKKFSIPVACIAFVLMGAPLGSLARKGGFATGIGLSLFFFIVYWAFLIGGEQLADSDLLPAFWAMWLPNIVIGTAGIILTIIFVRQSSVVSVFDRLRDLFRSGREKTGQA
jgi:lipopolysaccharide export system permease protein